MAELHLIKAYSLLESITPFAADCGKFCGRACCKGDSHTGMGLFPFEENLFKKAKGRNGFHLVSTKDNEGYPLCVCSGVCKRSLRPLACRMFPFFPLVYQDEKTGRLEIQVVHDPRGRSVCPVVQQKIPPQPIFERRLRRAARILLQDPIIREYVCKTSEFIADIQLLDRIVL